MRLAAAEIGVALVGEYGVEFLEGPIAGVGFEAEGGELLPEVVGGFRELRARIGAEGGQDERDFFFLEALTGLDRDALPNAVWSPDKTVGVRGKFLDVIAEDEVYVWFAAVLLEIPTAGAVGDDAGHEIGRAVAVEGRFAVEVGVESDLRSGR